MPAPVTSRPRESAKKSRANHDGPPAKKTKLSPPTPIPQQNGLKGLLNGTGAKKPVVTAKFNGVENARRENAEEATAVVSGHGDVDMADADKEIIEISSAEESSHYSSSDDEGADDAQAGAKEDAAAPAVNGHAREDDQPVYGTAEPEELSFGERLQAQDPEDVAPQVVDVASAFAENNMESKGLAATSNRVLAVPNASSLGSVLTQALRTNDQELLESCLRVVDVDTIYSTVERLPSPLVGQLLQKLAEKLYKRPGRAGLLMVWTQWSLASHGGYLASQPQLVRQLASLNRVLKERASGLQPLLSLKGRLDMLQAQLELRRRNQRRAANDDDEEAVIYVEGEDDVSSAAEDAFDIGSDAAPTNLTKRLPQGSIEDDESSGDEMPTTMEIDEDAEEDGSEDSDDLLDDEAEETDDDDGDDLSESISEDDFEDGVDVSESEEETKPARRSTIGRAGLSR